jgi:hypothetical protein
MAPGARSRAVRPSLPVPRLRAAVTTRPARSYSCSARTGWPRAGGRWVATGAGLDGRLGVYRRDPVTRRQPPALVVPLVQLEDDAGLPRRSPGHAERSRTGTARA